MSWWNIIKKLFTTNPDNVATHTNGISKDDFKTALDEFYSSVKKVYENENKLRDNSVQ